MFFLMAQVERWCPTYRSWVNQGFDVHNCGGHCSRRVRTRGVVDGRSDEIIFTVYARKVIQDVNPLVKMFTDMYEASVLAVEQATQNMAAFIDEIYNPEKRVGRSAQRSPYDVGRPEKAPKGLTASSTGWRKRR